MDHDGRPLLCARGGRRRAESIVRISCPHHEKPRRLRLVAGVDRFWIAAGALLLLGPIMAGLLGPSDYFTRSRLRFAAYDQLAAVCVIVMLIAMLLIAVAFFATSGASIVTIELLQRYVLPGLAPREERLTARVALSVIYGGGGVACRVLSGGRGGAFDARLAAVCSAVSCLSRPLLASLG